MAVTVLIILLIALDRSEIDEVSEVDLELS